ncbi:MAG: hypothetical protein D6725_08620, partial [Planctomycetota bacterium]
MSNAFRRSIGPTRRVGPTLFRGRWVGSAVFALLSVLATAESGVGQVLIQRGGALQVMVPGGNMAQFAAPARFPVDRRMVRQFREAEKALKEASEIVRRGERFDRKEVARSLRLIRQLLERGEDSLFDPAADLPEGRPAAERPPIPGLAPAPAAPAEPLQDPAKLKSLRELAESLLLELPLELRNVYEEEFGPQAMRLLEEASARVRLDRLLAVARSYPGTTAGRRALFRAAVVAWDSGAFGTAARLLERLRRDPLASTEYRSLAEVWEVACLLASGDAAAAERVWGDAAIPPAKR